MLAANNQNFKKMCTNYDNIKKMNYFVVRLTKAVKGLYIENYKTVLREIKELNRETSNVLEFKDSIFLSGPFSSK